MATEKALFALTISNRTLLGVSESKASRRAALQSEKRTPSLNNTSRWIFRSTGSKMRPSFLATCIIGLFGQKDRRTKSSKPALVSSFLESSLEFSFAGIECFRRLEADISPFLRMEAKLDKSVKW